MKNGQPHTEDANAMSRTSRCTFSGPNRVTIRLSEHATLDVDWDTIAAALADSQLAYPDHDGKKRIEYHVATPGRGVRITIEQTEDLVS